MLDKCFEFDWKMCKIEKIIKNPAEIMIVKNYLQPHYHLM